MSSTSAMAHTVRARRFHARTWLLRSAPLLATAVYYAGLSAVASLAFGVNIATAAIPADFLLQALLGYGLWLFFGRAFVALTAQGVLMGILHLGNAIKIAVLGGPIVPDDAYALPALLTILDGWLWFAAATPLALLAALLIFGARWRRRGFWLAIAGFALAVGALLSRPAAITAALDEFNGNVFWDQTANYTSRGAAMYWLHEGARFLAERDAPPDRTTVAAAVDGLPGQLIEVAAPKQLTRRNVHVIVMESFWDPSPLSAAAFNRDPLHPDFRALWNAGGNSRMLSPVFGGYTANAEFEALCGFPVTEDGVKFERRFRNSVPCLPAVLAMLGYASYASHPNVAAFWNRVNAYRRLGFDTYWSLPDFELDDLAGHMLSDRSLYRQVRAKLEQVGAKDQPIFNYILTYASHVPFTLNESRPHVVHSHSEVTDVAEYANVVYYSSKEFMEHIAALRENDPDAIIVAFGDHLPYLGVNRAAYQESEMLPQDLAEFSADNYKRYVGTPAIVIDGRNGVVPIGEMPLYQLPQLILRLLGADIARIMDYTEPPPGLKVRPLPGMHLVLTDDGNAQVCRGQSDAPLCDLSAAWLNRVDTIGTDLFLGQQYALPAPITPEAPLQVAF